MTENNDAGGFIYDSSSFVDELMSTLEHVYKDPGDGRTIVRELVQNAHDASSGDNAATKLAFMIATQGLESAENELLRGPALIVVNNGPFTAADFDGIRAIRGGSKRGDSDKVGRFGLGMKSIFHLCEAACFVGRDQTGVTRADVLNPWRPLGRPPATQRDKDWADLTAADRQKMAALGAWLAAEAPSFLVLWVPLRIQAHKRPRPTNAHDEDEVQEFLAKNFPTPDLVHEWFIRPQTLELLLAQTASLDEIGVWRADAVDITRLASLEPTLKVWRLGGQPPIMANRLPRPTTIEPSARIVRADGEFNSQHFGAKQEVTKVFWTWRRAIEHDLRKHAHWPKDPFGPDRLMRKRKAEEHAAISVLVGQPSDANGSGVTVRWATFFPLNDAAKPADEMARFSSVKDLDQRWDIILHGYFFPDQNRRGIAGVTDASTLPEGGATKPDEVILAWNLAIRDELLLPQLPAALERALAGAAADRALKLVQALSNNPLLMPHWEAVRQECWMIPEVTTGEVVWVAVDRLERCNYRELSGWGNAPEWLRRAWLPALERRGIRLADAVSLNKSKLAGELAAWTAVEVATLFEAAGCPPSLDDGLAFAVQKAIELLSGLKKQAGRIFAEDAVCSWLVRLQAGQLGPNGTKQKKSTNDIGDQLQSRWRDLTAQLSSVNRLIVVSTNCREAIEKFANAASASDANENSTLLIPWNEKDPNPLAVGDCSVDRAMSVLQKVAENLRNDKLKHRDSWMDLAKSLVAHLGLDKVCGDAHLAAAPVLTAWSTQVGKDFAISPNYVRQAIVEMRTFTAPQESKFHDLAKDFGNCVQADILLLGADMSDSERTPTLNNDAMLARLGDRKWQLAPDFAQREGVLARLKEKTSDPEARARLRWLLHGNRDDSDDNAYLAKVVQADSDLWIAVRAFLDATELGWTLLQPAANTALRAWSETELDAVGVRSWNREEFCDFLSDNEDLEKLRAVGAVERKALLRLTAKHEVFARLPLHTKTDGQRVALDADRAFLASQLELPQTLASKFDLIVFEDEFARVYRELLLPVDATEILRAALEDADPERHALLICKEFGDRDIENAMRAEFSELKELFLHSRWLSMGTAGKSCAPDQVLFLPHEVARHLLPLAEAGGLGDAVLDGQVDWSAGAKLREIVCAAVGAGAEFESLAEHLDLSAVPPNVSIAWSITHDVKWISDERLVWGRSCPELAANRGWKLLQLTADKVLEDATFQRLASRLIGDLGRQAWAELLGYLTANQPAANSNQAKLLKNYLTALPADLRTDVLGQLKLPTGDGKWRSGGEIAAAKSGPAPRWLLRTDLLNSLNFDELSIAAPPAGGSASAQQGLIAELNQFFDPWKGLVDPLLVGLFIACLSSADAEIGKLAQKWLGDRARVETVRRQLGLTSTNPDVRTGVNRIAISSVGRVAKFPSLAGTWIDVEVVERFDSIIAICQRHLRPNAFDTDGTWTLTLNPIDAKHYNALELRTSLKNAAILWSQRRWAIGPEVANDWWSRYATTAQLEVKPVRQLILRQLEQTLRHLRADKHAKIAPILGEILQLEKDIVAEDRVSQRSQIESKKAKLMRDLSELIEKDEGIQAHLLSKVREHIGQQGYSHRSVLLELFQNADDALNQLAELEGRSLPIEAQHFEVLRNDRAMTVSHWGRPVNFTNDLGKVRGWDNDLYNMLLMNMSGKVAAQPASESATTATTGHFGLGFKSVHLLCDEPEIESGYLAFKIKGGLLPFEQNRGATETRRGGRLPTVFRLGLNDQAQGKQAIEYFATFAALIPAFSLQIRTISLPGQEFAFGPEEIPSASGWTITKAALDFGAQTAVRFLRFQPLRNGNLTGPRAALIWAVKSDGQIVEMKNVPTIWQVLPLAGENWGIGYLINGPFAVDPGRSRLNLSDTKTLTTIQELGEQLGQGLVELFRSPFAAKNHDDFWRSFITVLSGRLAALDVDRQNFLKSLNGPKAGLGHLLRQETVLPSGLARPFREKLPPLTTPSRVEVADGVLALPEVATVLDQIDSIAADLSRRSFVSTKAAEGLQSVLQWHRRVKLDDVIEEWLERVEYKLEPKAAATLAPLAEAKLLESWKKEWSSQDASNANWREKLLIQDSSGGWSPSGKLLLKLSSEPPESAALHQFAPRSHVGASEYAGKAAVFLTQIGFKWEPTDDQIANWARDLMTAAAKSACLQYLSCSGIGSRIAELLKKSGIPQWIGRRGDFQELAVKAKLDLAQAQILEISLFGPIPPSGGQDPVNFPLFSTQKPVDAKRALNLLWDKWKDKKYSESRLLVWHQKWYPPTWPGARLRAAFTGSHQELREAWMMLFVLAAAQGLGLKAEAHRGFVSHLQADDAPDGLWALLTSEASGDVDLDGPKWIATLTHWAEKRAKTSDAFDHWMRLLPELFVLWRWFVDYQIDLTGLHHPMRQVTALLDAPSDNSQRGTQAQTPPIHHTVRKNWLIRELVRLGAIRSASKMHMHCFQDCKALQKVFDLYGISGYGGIKARIGVDRADFHGCFDIPLLLDGVHCALNERLTNAENVKLDDDDFLSSDIG